jgi:hypothetical protein
MPIGPLCCTIITTFGKDVVVQILFFPESSAFPLLLHCNPHLFSLPMSPPLPLVINFRTVSSKMETVRWTPNVSGRLATEQRECSCICHCNGFFAFLSCCFTAQRFSFPPLHIHRQSFSLSYYVYIQRFVPFFLGGSYFFASPFDFTLR